MKRGGTPSRAFSTTWNAMQGAEEIAHSSRLTSWIYSFRQPEQGGRVAPITNSLCWSHRPHGTNDLMTLSIAIQSKRLTAAVSRTAESAPASRPIDDDAGPPRAADRQTFSTGRFRSIRISRYTRISGKTYSLSSSNPRRVERRLSISLIAIHGFTTPCQVDLPVLNI